MIGRIKKLAKKVDDAGCFNYMAECSYLLFAGFLVVEASCEAADGALYTCVALGTLGALGMLAFAAHFIIMAGEEAAAGRRRGVRRG